MDSEERKEIVKFPISDCDYSTIDTLTDWVERGLSLDEQDEYGRTALNFYSLEGRIRVVEFLLDNGANPNIRDVEGNTPLHFAHNSTDLLRLFIAKGVDLDMKDNIGWTLLHRACFFNHVEHIQILLENGASTSVKDGKDQTPFHIAVEKCETDVLRMFIARGVDLDVKDNFGRTPLHRACFFNCVELVRFLLESGASTSVKDGKGQTPYDIAVEKCEIDVLLMFVDKGVNVSDQDKLGQTLLHKACQKGSMEIIEDLLEKGADIDALDFKGWTPLMYAIRFSTFDIVQFLIQRGAFINIKDQNGDTPLHIAAKYSSFLDLKCRRLPYLFNQGALVGIRNKQNRTAYGEFMLRRPTSHEPYGIKFDFGNHILKMKVLYPVDEEIADNSTLRKVRQAVLGKGSSFQKEVDKIKSTRVSFGFFLYQVVTQRNKPKYLLNKPRVQRLKALFESPDFLSKFPNYGKVLISLFKRSLRSRYYLRHQALNSIFGNLQCNGGCAILPAELWEIVFSYLDESDLYTLVKALRG